MKTFNIFGQAIKISNDFEKYNAYKKVFTGDFLKASGLFTDTYNENITNLDILITKIPEIAMRLIKNEIYTIIPMLVREGILNIDENTFLQKYYHTYFNFDNYYDPILEKYVEITEASGKLKEYRELQKSTRSRWQGGGFGISGAMKGAMQAGALNMGTDFLRSFGDASKSLKDASKISSMKKAIFNNPNTFMSLRQGIINCIFGEFYGFIDELVLNKVIAPIKLSEKEANIIFQNTLKYEQSQEKRIKSIIECIIMNPYNFEFYKALLDINEKNEDVITMAIYFGFEDKINSLTYEKLKMKVNQDLSNLNNLSMDYLSKIISDYNSFSIELKELLKNDYNRFEKKYHELDVALRTFNEKVYSSKKERDIAEEIFSRTYNGVVYSSLTKKKAIIRNDKEILSRTYEGVVYNTVAEKNSAEQNDKEILSRTYEGIVYTTIDKKNSAVQKDINIKQKLEADAQRKYENSIIKGFIIGFIILALVLYFLNSLPKGKSYKNLLETPLVAMENITSMNFQNKAWNEK